MAELMVDLIITLDGCASGEGWPGWWGLEGPEYLAWLQQEARTQRTYLMGANTYRLMSGMSEDAAAGGTGYSEDESASLTGLAAVPKVSFRPAWRRPSSGRTPSWWPVTPLRPSGR